MEKGQGWTIGSANAAVGVVETGVVELEVEVLGMRIGTWLGDGEAGK